MSKRTIGVLATSAALCALIVATDASAFGGGHGGGGGGGGFHGGGGGGGFGGFHGGGGGFGGFHGGGGGLHAGGFSAFHAGGVHGFAGRSMGFHGYGGHAYGAHAYSHAFAAHNFGAHGVHGVHGSSSRHFATREMGERGHVGRGEDHGAAAGRGREAARHQIEGTNRTEAHQFAHNQLAAQRYHGLNNFNRTGFNRNAFGNARNWNRWAGRFWGAGWHRWGWGWGGWAGPVFWPFLFGDVFTFAFWPYDYYDPFWAFGPDFVLASVFTLGPYFGPDYGYAPDYYGYQGFPNIYYSDAGYAGSDSGGPSYAGSGSSRSGNGRYFAKATQGDREALARTDAAAQQSCGGLAPGVTTLPIDRIRQSIHPTADQEAALDELSSASSKANDIVGASCPKDIPLVPVGRLDAAEQRLDAMMQAAQIMRGPLEKFYDSLSDDQRQKFDAMSGSGRAGPPAGNLATLCGQQPADLASLPVQRIEQVVQPTAQQQGAFDDLKKASETAANGLQASCPSQMPQTPVARLDAVTTRLGAMVDALKTVRPKLVDFYATLNDEQKARFNTIGPPPQSASTQSQGQGGDVKD